MILTDYDNHYGARSQPVPLANRRISGRYRQLLITTSLATELVTPSVTLPRLILSRLECGPMPDAMTALPNIGGALCSTPQSLADAHY